MQVQIALPDDVANSLEAKWGNLEQKLLEMLIISAYCEGSLSVGKVRQLLGLATRMEADAWLQARNVDLPYSKVDFDADRETHKKLRQEGTLLT